jgi:hypothetical protein
MMKPITDLKDFQAQVRLGVTTESLHLEFKEKADGFSSKAAAPGKEKGQLSAVADIAQFANNEGGCLLYGIKEADIPGSQLTIAEAVTGIAQPDDMQNWLEDAIGRYATPRTLVRNIFPIPTPGGVVLSVVVPPSRNLVSVWNSGNHTVKYPRRTSYGTAWMNPDDVERHIMNGSRAARIALEQAAQKAGKDGHGDATVHLVDGLRRETAGQPHQRMGRPGPKVTAKNFRADSFDLKVTTSSERSWETSVPYGVVTEAWLTPPALPNIPPRVGLLLDVIVVIPQDDNTGSLILERV